MSIDEIRKNLESFLRDNRCNAADFETVNDSCIGCYIYWGDWKHEHLRFERLVEKFFSDMDIDYVMESSVIEEDGSDTYSAEYRILVKNKLAESLDSNERLYVCPVCGAEFYQSKDVDELYCPECLSHLRVGDSGECTEDEEEY